MVAIVLALALVREGQKERMEWNVMMDEMMLDGYMVFFCLTLLLLSVYLSVCLSVYMEPVGGYRENVFFCTIG